MATDPDEAREALKERYTRFMARQSGRTVDEVNLTFAENSNNKALIDEIMLWYKEMTEDERPPEPEWKQGDTLEG